MTTSLAQQLKKLAVPQTTLLLRENINTRASLLFDPKEAANLDRDAIFAIGLTGLEELTLLNPIFESYDQTLFNETSKNFQRSIQTKESNSNLDNVIRSFLISVSPYLLLRPAHKALEWLINRYSIHMFNVDDLVACILPYHEANIFVRILQLIDLKNPAGRWHWLQPLQKPGLTLNKAVLINQCCNLSFLKFVANLVPSSIKVFGCSAVPPTLYSFYAVVIAGAIHAADVSEDLLAALLPFFLKGLKSESSDYQGATYMIICQLVHKVKLNDDILDKLLIRIVQRPLPGMTKECIACLSVVFLHQNIDKLSEKFVELISDSKELWPEIENFSETHNLTSLLVPVIKKLILTSFVEKKSQKVKFLLTLLKEARFERKAIVKIIKFLFNQYLDRLKTNSKLKKTCGKYLCILDSRYPAETEEAVESYINGCKTKNKVRIQALLFSSGSSKNKVIGKKEDLLFLCTVHPNATRRKTGIEALIDMFRKKKVTNKDFVKDCLVPRLLDEDYSVVATVLHLEKDLIEIIGKEKLFGIFHDILSTNYHSNIQEWEMVKKKILKLLVDSEGFVSGPKEFQIELLMTLLPMLFARTNQQAEFLSLILKDALLSQNLVFLQLTAKGLKEPDAELEQWNESLIQSLLSAIENVPRDELIQLMNGMKIRLQASKSSNILHFLGLNALNRLIKDDKIALERSKHFEYFLELVKNSLPMLETEVKPFLEVISDGKIPFVTIEKGFKAVYPTKDQEMQISLFNFLSTYSYGKMVDLRTDFKKILFNYFQAQFKSLDKQIIFLSMLWSSPNSFNSLLTTTDLLEETKETDIFFRWDSNVPLAFLVCLTDSKTRERKQALIALEKVLNKTQEATKGQPFQLLLQRILSHRQDVEMDQRQLPQLLSVWFQSSLSETPGVTKREGMSTRRNNNVLETSAETILLNQLIKSLCDSDTTERNLLGVLNALSCCNSPGLLSSLLSLFHKLLDRNEIVGKITNVTGSIFRSLLTKYDQETALLMVDIEAPAYKALERALKSSLKEVDGESLQNMAVRQVTRKFFEFIPSSEVKQNLLNLLLTSYVSSEDTTKENALWKVLKKISSDSRLASRELQLEEIQSEPQTIKEARLTRTQSTLLTSTDPVESAVTLERLEKQDWKRIIVLLEILQSKKDLEDPFWLVNPLFDLLKRSLEMGTTAKLEYVRQLILTSLHAVCLHLQANKSQRLKEEQFQVDLAVQCIRVSDNPRTQHQALILLNLAAQMFPDHILHNIMAIFTFMGASLVRQDDSYSFQVILNTVETIIPALMKANECRPEGDKTTTNVIAGVTQVFVDALPDIPPHRSLPLFSKLVQTLGPNQYLWYPLTQLCALRSLRAEENRENSSQVTEFASELALSFYPGLQVSACVKMMEFLASLPEEMAGKTPELNSEISQLFDLRNNSDKQLRLFKYAVVSFITSLLGSKEFISQVSDLKNKLVDKMEVLYRHLLETTLKYLQKVAQKVNENSQKATFKYWRAYQHKLYDLIEKVNSLLPSDQFLAVVEGLLVHHIPSVSRKAMEMLNTKLVHQQGFFKQEDLPSILGLIKPLTKIIKTDRKRNSGQTGDREELIVNQQTALLSLKLICRLAGPSNPSQFKKVLQVSIKLLNNWKKSTQLTACSLLCLAELCHCLKAHSLPYLNQFMPIVIELLEDLETLKSNDLLLLSLVTTIHRLIENLSGFLSSYVHTILLQICKISCLHQDNESSNKTTLQQKLKGVRNQLATNLPGRIIFPAINQCYQSLAETTEDQTSIKPLMGILGDRIDSMEKKELNGHLNELQNFFLKGLDFRQNNLKISVVSLNVVEESVIEAMMIFVLKLSEVSFRPIFYKIYEWAVCEEEIHNHRVLTFYRLTCSLAERLKSLFVLFAGHFIQNVAKILKSNNAALTGVQYYGNSKRNQEQADQLLEYVLQTLYLCFLHDNKCLVDKDCFEQLMQPLVDQIDNFTEDGYENRITKFLSPCLAQFSVAVADDTCWKPLNYQILLKTRNPLPKVRFAALEILQRIVQSLGDDYMVLLPETIPFLAELMEDESFEVEQQCQTVVAKMELILGEPLMKYF